MYCCCILQNGQRLSLPALWWLNDSGEEVQSRKLANVLHQVCSLERGDFWFLVLPRVPECWLVNVPCLQTGTLSQPCSNGLVSHMLRDFLDWFTYSVSLSTGSLLGLDFNLLLLIHTAGETMLSLDQPKAEVCNFKI